VVTKKKAKIAEAYENIIKKETNITKSGIAIFNG